MIINYDKKNPVLFSVTKKDFDIQYFKGSGAGGQKRNKTENACRMVHRDSGARGECQNHRSKDQNTKEAFKRLVATQKFQTWLKYQASVISGEAEAIEKKVDKLMEGKYLKTEVFQDKKWSQYEDSAS